MNSTTDIIIQMLLGRQELGAGSDDMSLSDQLAKLGEADPRLVPLIRHLQERLAESSDVVDITPAQEEGEGDETVESSVVAEGNQELESLAQGMFAEIEVLRARNDMLATALGACHLCWGEDQGCPYCSGAGCVGTYVIKASLFEHVVGPAVRQLRQRPRAVKSQNMGKGGNHAD